MKKILVPCDFTETAVQAFRFACNIAFKSKGEIFVLHVVELPVLPNSLFVPIHAYEKNFIKGIKEKVEKNFIKMKERWGGKLKIHLVVQQGSVKSTIKKFADAKKIDLILIGTHGASGIREHTIGSNAEKVVRTSGVPVISVKKGGGASIKNIILPTDLSTASKEFVSSVKQLQGLFKAKLHIVFVNTLTKFNTDTVLRPKMDEFVRKNKFKNFTANIYNDMDEEKGISNFTGLFKSKMIAMSTHGRTGLGHLILRSFAEDVVNHVDCPVWTYARP